MSQSAIFIPFLAMMALSSGVIILLAVRRAKDARKTGLGPAQLPPTRSAHNASGEPPLWSPRTEAAGDQVQNLFETPVLFYGLCLALFVTSSVTGYIMGLAWGYVGFRLVHAFIHLSYNHVMQRFLAFLLSILCLLLMMISLALAIT